MRHKHADVIEAAIEDKEVQTFSDGQWVTMTGHGALLHWTWRDDVKYRVKPKPPVKKWRWILEHKGLKTLHVSNQYYSEDTELENLMLIKIQKIDSTIIEVQED